MNALLYPPSIDWELTPACNHKCIHCYNYWRGQNDSACERKTEEYYNAIAERIIQSHPVSVQITGGEPLLVWSLAKNAIQRMLDAGIHVSINTNATLVNEEIAVFLSRNDMDAFVSFPCTDPAVFDRIVHCEGATDRVDRGIRLLLAHGVRVSLNMVVTRINLAYVYETALYVKNTYGVSYFSATKASCPQNADPAFREQMLSREEFQDMLTVMLRVKRETGMRVDSAWVYSLCGFRDADLLEQFGFHRKCTCGRYNFVVDANGAMKACGCDSRSYGNLLEESFTDAISRMNDWQTGVLLPEECKACSHLRDCGGGCRADAYSTNNRNCTLDSTADPTRKERIEVHREIPEYPGELCMKIGDGVRWVRDRGGVRLSNRTNYVFLTEEFAQYLRQKKVFSVRQLTDASSAEKAEVHHCVFLLLKKRILEITEEPADELETSGKPFSLEYHPYSSKELPAYAQDYVYETSVRYAN